MSRSASAAAPVLLGIGAAAAALACACNVPPGLDRQSDWEEAQPGLFSMGPYIVLGSAGTAYVSLKDEGIPAPVVDWWVQPEQADRAGGTAAAAPSPGVMKSVTARRNEDMWVAELHQLPIGPAIRYRVRSAVGTTPAYQFRVGVEKDKRFRFAVFGDTRSGHSVHRSIVEALDREQVDFAVHTGDMVEQGGRQDQWARFFQIERPLLVDTPMMPLVGNHDVSGRDYFRHYFLHALWAGNEHYFVRDWGQLRIVGVDSGVECREGCSQYFFAERALAEGERQGKLMVLALHYPPYSSGEHGSSADVQGPISTLARRHGVELVLTGHDHDYERTKPIDGTTYVVTGSSGAPIRPVTPRWFTAEARTEPHYVLVDVEAKRLILRAVNLAGETFDTAVIDENPPHR
jgi:predicted phosphodiesterase